MIKSLSFTSTLHVAPEHFVMKILFCHAVILLCHSSKLSFSSSHFSISRPILGFKILANPAGMVCILSVWFDYFMCHKLTVDGVDREHVRWLKKHPHKQCLGNFNSLCVWDGSNFEARAPNCFLPVHRIHSLFAGAYLFDDEAKLMAVCPIPRRASILPVR